MSWFLKHKKLLVVILLGLIAMGLLFIKVWLWALVLFAIIVCAVLNQIIKKKYYQEYVNFTPKREVKIINTLVIGDVCSLKTLTKFIDKDKTLFLTCPKRSVEASFQILLHTFSRIDGNGHIVIVDNGEKSHSVYTFFDTIWMNYITKKELGLERISGRSKYPLLFNPFVSFLILIGYKSNKYKMDVCPDNEIINFCKERNFKLSYLIKK